MVCSTKCCLRKMIGRAKLSSEELITLLTEVEMIINCRPLSFISQDDLGEPFTRSRLLVGRRLMSLPDHLCQVDQEDYDPEAISPNVLSKCLKFLHTTLDRFWSRWRSEYLLELHSSHCCNSLNTSGSKPITVEDIMIIHDEHLKWGFWRVGVVEEMLHGSDRSVRAADLRVFTRGKGCKRLRRPVQRLYSLEIKARLDKPGLLENEKEKGIESERGRENENENRQGGQGEVAITDEHLTSLSGVSVEKKNESTERPLSLTRPKRASAIEARDQSVAQTLD